MKKINLRLLTTALILVAIFTSACGAKKEASYGGRTGSVAMPEAIEESADNAVQSEYTSDSTAPETEGEITSESKNTNSVETNRKLIKRVQMDVETKDFEGLLEAVNSKVENLNGYMESSEVSGNTYFNENGSRYASMVIRIPSKNLKSFVAAVKEMGNVVNSSESTEDITLQYVDVESHKNALIVEQERLIDILKNAKKLEDIIKIENRLSDVRYEIESYESQIRTFDNLVDYSTITLSINEVRHITPVEDETVLQRMRSGLSSTFFNLKTGAQNFAVWFVVNLPYLIIWAIIIAAMAFSIKKILKKVENNNMKSNIKMPYTDNKVKEETKKDPADK
ncbi:uncharacterized protein DUF4349 [Mobilisporobacter senegalensis]|uniref:Uncharacterized protein DUF4349 n=1 Tax=Mobilisporobacter senegalensis TaxID=1329262 RepID=A0A3N1XSZ7_9FIRM|nr:DUF4349 domain-containing protein [Mobilisporobacter senegalensis]ROR29368.1 uncharacterized protein DUF4349 [Mobilisporobacter senegalensis]